MMSLLLIQDTDVFTNSNFSLLVKTLVSVFFGLWVSVKNFLGLNKIDIFQSFVDIFNLKGIY